MLFISLQAGSNGIASILTMVVLFAIFYFFFIRPQMQKQKEQVSFQSAIKKGDEVVTASGIIGKISKIDEKEVTLELSEKVFIRCTRNAISKDMTEEFFKSKS
jgi:preprotein translocase subunit YajC